jgi:hypothetical protein
LRPFLWHQTRIRHVLPVPRCDGLIQVSKCHNAHPQHAHGWSTCSMVVLDEWRTRELDRISLTYFHTSEGAATGRPLCLEGRFLCVRKRCEFWSTPTRVIAKRRS